MPALVNGTFTQGSAAAGGGTAIWANTAGADSPLTGAFPARDYLYLPSNVTYFSAIPTGASVDGQYLATMADAANPRGPSEGYVAGLWLNRGSAASLATNNAPVLIHGTTNVASRYTALATNPFSRSDFERIWGWVVQSALWSNLTDEAKLDQTITVDTLGDRTFGDPDVVVHATATSGRTVNLAATGDCTLDGPTAPATLHLTGAGSCTVTASQPGNANYNAAPDVVQTFAIAQAAQTITFEQPASPATYGSTFNVAPTATSGLPVSVAASGGCTISGSTVTMTSGTVDCVLTASQAGNDDYLAGGRRRPHGGGGEGRPARCGRRRRTRRGSTATPTRRSRRSSRAGSSATGRARSRPPRRARRRPRRARPSARTRSRAPAAWRRTTRSPTRAAR